jgi:hypothetical protein
VFRLNTVSTSGFSISTSSFVASSDPSGNPLTGWTVSVPTTTSVNVTTSVISGIFTNFRFLAASSATTPYTYCAGVFAKGASLNANVKITLNVNGTITIVFATLSAGEIGYSAANTPVYFIMDLITSPNIII